MYLKNRFDRIKNRLQEPFTINFTLKWQHVFFFMMLFWAFSGVACGSQDSANIQNAQNACDMWGCSPAITHYYEYHQLQQIYEERDNPDTILHVYLYSQQTGQLTCFGNSYGYGIPYGTQMSSGSTAEANGLYPSGSTNADWVNRSALKTKQDQIKPEFVEPEVIISPNVYPCTSLKGDSHG